MWSRALMRLFSLSFISLFVIGVLWDRDNRRSEATGHKPAPDKRRDDKSQ
jgi:hypothetical protein